MIKERLDPMIHNKRANIVIKLKGAIFFVIFLSMSILVFGDTFYDKHKSIHLSYCISIDNKLISKKMAKTIVDNGKKPIFAPQFTAEERWVSG